MKWTEILYNPKNDSAYVYCTNGDILCAKVSEFGCKNFSWQIIHRGETKKMSMKEDEFREILWGDNPDFEAVTESVMEDQSRWHIFKSQVFKQESTGKFFEASWQEGATEYQDADGTDWSFYEVEPFEETITRYKVVADGLKFEP